MEIGRRAVRRIRSYERVGARRHASALGVAGESSQEVENGLVLRGAHAAVGEERRRGREAGRLRRRPRREVSGICHSATESQREVLRSRLPRGKVLEARSRARAADENGEERALGCCQGRPRTFGTPAGYVRGGSGIAGQLRERDAVACDTSLWRKVAKPTSAIFVMFGLTVRAVNYSQRFRACRVTHRVGRHRAGYLGGPLRPLTPAPWPHERLPSEVCTTCSAPSAGALACILVPSGQRSQRGGK